MKYGLICFVFLCRILCASVAPLRQGRMAGGIPVTSNKYPWVVAMIVSYNATEPDTATVIKEHGHEELKTYSTCTGCIIDVYGTVITSAHCVERWKERSLKNRTIIYQLVDVLVKWGSTLSILADEFYDRSEIIDLSRVRLHPESFLMHGIKRRINIDVALIYLSTFNPPNTINCSSSSTARPIQMSNIYPKIHNPTIGRIAGFGRQPITRSDNGILGYAGMGQSNLTENVVEYGGRMDETKEKPIYYDSSMNTSSEFYATARIYENVPMNWTSKWGYNGPCRGDSGGPCMEDESGETILRGIIIGPCRPSNCHDLCTRENRSSAFVDLNYGPIREWIINQTRSRYIDMRVQTRIVPQTC